MAGGGGKVPEVALLLVFPTKRASPPVSPKPSTPVSRRALGRVLTQRARTRAWSAPTCPPRDPVGSRFGALDHFSDSLLRFCLGKREVGTPARLVQGYGCQGPNEWGSCGFTPSWDAVQGLYGPGGRRPRCPWSGYPVANADVEDLRAWPLPPPALRATARAPPANVIRSPQVCALRSLACTFQV